MAYIEVDIDLSEFDTDDLISELSYRISKYSFSSRKGFSKEKQDELKKKILNDFCDIPELIGLEIIEGFEVKTLDDKMKIEHIINIFNKYSLSYIESVLP